MKLSPDMILVGILLLALLLLWWEYHRANTARRLLRCMAILVATAALAALAYPLKNTNERSNTGILLTAGYDKDSLSAIQKQYPAIPVYTPENYFASGDTSISNWHVLGYGMNRDALSSLDAQKIFFHPSPIKTGITHINWQQTLNDEEPLVVQGTCTNNESVIVQIILEGYGTVQDTISIPAHSTSSFVVQSPVKHSGQAVFRLQLKQGKKLIEDNAVAFTTIPSKKLRLLLLSSAPDFEYRFLQNWLGKSGYPSAIRTMTSRDKVEQAFINRSPITLRNLTGNLLDSFDLVLGDVAALDALNENERTAIRQQIADKGLGLLLRADTISSSRFYTKDILLQSIKTNAQQTILPKLINENTALANLPAPEPIIVRKNAQLNDWVTDTAGNTLVAASLYGMGKIAIATLDNTYQWLLSGQESAYSIYWSRLLQSAARKETNNMALLPVPGIYTREQTIPVQLVYADTMPPAVTADNSIHLAMHQQTIPFLWQGTFWPLQEGWQEINSGGNTAYLYIYDSKEWPMIKASERLEATASRAKQESATAGAAAPIMVWKKWWFLVLFLLSMVFLWVERKYFT